MINVLRKCVIGATALREVEEKRTMGRNILIFSVLGSGKSLVIIKIDLIDFFGFILSIFNFF